MTFWSPAHLAVEHEDLPRLRELLDWLAAEIMRAWVDRDRRPGAS